MAWLPIGDWPRCYLHSRLFHGISSQRDHRRYVRTAEVLPDSLQALAARGRVERGTRDTEYMQPLLDDGWKSACWTASGLESRALSIYDIRERVAAWGESGFR